MSNNIAQSHQRGRAMNGQFVRQLPPGAATPPYVRVSRTIANPQTGRKVVSVGYIDGEFLAEQNLALPVGGLVPVGKGHFDVVFAELAP
jgi:hypothetical protein